MPELPEVEHVVRALRSVVVGRKIVASEVRLAKLIAPLSARAFNQRIKQSSIAGVSRRGKFILIDLARDVALPHGRASDTRSRRAGILPAKRAQRAQELILAVHLRMTGKFVLLNTDDELPKHAHAIFYLDHDQRL